MNSFPLTPESLPARTHELLIRWAITRPDAIAVEDATRQLTYGALAAAVDRGETLLAQHRVRPGDRVLIVTENSVAAVVLMFATQRLDAWPAMVNARIPPREVDALRECADARLCAYVIDQSTAAEKHALGDTAATLDDPGFGRIALGAVSDTCPVESVHAENQRQVGLMLFTSGTTGTPKAVMLSHFGLINMGATLAHTRHTQPDNRYSGAAPLSHIMGQASLMNTLWAGAALELMPRVEIAQLAAGIASGRMTHLSFVPTVYARLLDHIERNAVDLSRQRLIYISSGGAPLDPELKLRIERMFSLPMVNGYGMTECAPALRSRHDRYGGAPGCIGKPEPGVEARIVDGNGRDIGYEDVGELWVKSPSVMMGYYRNPEATARTLHPGGWLATGDLARWLPENEIAIVGRAKEMIIRSGFNVYPAEVEAALNSLPGVMHSGVVGRPMAGGDEEVVAFVELRPAAETSEARLLAELRDLVAPYKRPSRIIVLDALPLGPTGKVLKRRLSELAAATATAAG